MGFALVEFSPAIKCQGPKIKCRSEVGKKKQFWTSCYFTFSPMFSNLYT